jgi:FixJ family two-component response regulator
MRRNEIFILDDDANVRETLRVVLQQAGYEPICFANEVALFRTVRQCPPRCVLLDLVFCGSSGLEILEHLVKLAVPTIMMSGHADISTALDAMRRGARDFIEKPFTAEVIVDRLKEVLRQNLQTVELAAFKVGELSKLTRREREITEQILMGQSNKEAGLVLHISPRTVEQHRARIMLKLGVRNAAELAAAVLQPAGETS